MKTPLRVLACVVAGCLLMGLSASADDIRIDKDDRMVTVTANGKTVMKYRYGDGPSRPYVIELCTPFIGTGGRCGAHIGYCLKLKEHGICDTVAVCDVYAPRLEAAAIPFHPEVATA